MTEKYNEIRRRADEVKIGGVSIGGKNHIAVQSMTNTDTHDAEKTLEQVKQLALCGCDIVRITAPDAAAAKTFAYIKEQGINTPLVADIHFDYKIALECIAAGVDKIRINPGNIGDDMRVRAVAKECAAKNIPIRIGVNSGSLEKHILEKYGSPCAEALAESALFHVSLLEKFDFNNIVISVKSSSVRCMIGANRILAEKTSYPLHLGVTEAGGGNRGIIKGAAGIGALLCDGIGDTLRVSLTDNPCEEVKCAKAILSSLGFAKSDGLDIVSCPTCGRTKIDLISLAKEFESAAEIAGITDMNIKVAIMGCVVNGPGEAREADIGICGGDGEALLIKKGEIVKKLPEGQIISTLIEEILKIKAGK